jgi:hypothetical protein
VIKDTPISNHSKHWLREMREMESDLEELTTPYPTLVSKAALLATAETGQQVQSDEVQERVEAPVIRLTVRQAT